MNKDLLINLIKLSRVGANSLGASQSPQSMIDVWSVISEAEKLLQPPLPSTESVAQSQSDASAP
jgi:hypothetical protein